MRTFERDYYPAASYNPTYSNWGSISYHAGDGADYTQQEAEWDRAALLDPLWEIQQRKTFLAWINSHLRKAGTNIENLEEDFQNGLKLMLLLEVISGEPLPRPDRGKTRFHRIANVNKALNFISRRGVKLVSLGAEEVVDGNSKMTLGLIWTIILRFAIESINVGELSARDGLLLWCQRKTAPYDNVNVQNFSTSWKDGLAFCALIHRHRPELIDYNALNEHDPIGNLNLAFDVAEKHLDIPKMLEAEDIVYSQRPDEKSIMTYVSCFYHAFEDQHPNFAQLNGAPRISRSLTPNRMSVPPPQPIELFPRQQTPIRQLTPVQLQSPMPPSSPLVRVPVDPREAEKAANRIGRALDVNRDNQAMADEYEGLSSDLLDWINRWIPWMSKRGDEPTLDSAKQKLNDFRQYRRLEKPPRIDQKGRLETALNNLQTRLRLGNRPPFVPSDGHHIKDINHAWQNLEQSETGFESWLLSEMMRLQRLDQLVEKFHRKCTLHNDWSDGKERQMQSQDYKSSDVYKIKALRKRHEAFESELSCHQERVEQIVEIAKELNNLRYLHVSEINIKSAEICSQWEKLINLSTKRQENLEKMETITAELDDLHLKFAKMGTPFKNWVDSVCEDLSDLVIANNLNEIETLQDEHNKFKETLPTAEKSLREIHNLEQKIQKLVQTHSLDLNLLRNPYTDLEISTLNKFWNALLEQIPRRDSELRQENGRQKHNEQLRQQFAERANVIGPWLERQLEQVLSIGSAGKGTLEDGLIQLRNIQQNARNEKSKLEELERINQQLHENFVFDALGSRYSMESLRVGMETLMTATYRVINELENQVLLRDGKGISEEQLNEYRTSFAHFDKDRKGLTEDQLRSFLISIGHHNEVRDGKEDVKVQQIMRQLDANNVGRVSLNSLIDFLTHENVDSDSVDQMIEAFKLLANGKPTISADEIRRELPTGQADHCIREMQSFRDSKTGELDYNSFARSLYIR
ncbi:Calponin actin-binding and Spectrin repeat and EF-hand domain containing protein [Aphelenchoides besseyi]|nr:Calponin actin-binding and Spectrin repeat and EF-hand domain containing protein [Aphelenchoides besseyi]